MSAVAILTSIHGSRIGLDALGRLIINLVDGKQVIVDQTMISYNETTNELQDGNGDVISGALTVVDGGTATSVYAGTTPINGGNA